MKSRKYFSYQTITPSPQNYPRRLQNQGFNLGEKET